MMKNLRILVIEDSEDDTLLVVHQVKKGNYDVYFERVETKESMNRALKEKKWDIILSDYVMPYFNGLDALTLLKETGLDIPFIIISGVIGEEVAVEAMRKGAHDYIMKNNLKRLIPAIERELREAQSRSERKLFEQKKKQAEESLRESEERYRLIAENTADTITILDLELNIIYNSPSVQKLLGYTVMETLSQPLEQILTPVSLQKAKAVLAEQLKLEENSTADPSRFVLLELEEIHKNGFIVQVEVSVSFIRDNNLIPTSILVVSRDITKRKQAEEELKVLSYAVEQNPAMVLITDIDGNIEYVNSKYEEVTGYSKAEVIGKKPSIVKSGKMPGIIYKELWGTINSHSTWQGELINKKKDGTFYWVNISISPISDNEENVSHFVSISEDITNKKKIEEELIIAKERAEESDRLKTAFLQNMSHEIRTPMNAIIGFSRLMASEYESKETLEYYSQIINNNCTNLLEIIDGIIDMSRIDSGELSIHYDECNINELFNELNLFFKEYRIRLEKQHIEFRLQPFYGSFDTIMTDPDKLKQILINLINNAFKFTNTGKITVGCKFDKNQNIVFFVSDTGIGIPNDKHSVIFERFVKLDQDKTTFYDGSGLGLAIVKEFVELLGGNLWLESELSKGSTFYFSLPFRILRK